MDADVADNLLCIYILQRSEQCKLELQENAFNYDKGVLAEILEPIMGKGLIPADLETWKPRRRAIVPAFHKAYLEAMVSMFGACTQESIHGLDALTANGSQVFSHTVKQPWSTWRHILYFCIATLHI